MGSTVGVTKGTRLELEGSIRVELLIRSGGKLDSKTPVLGGTEDPRGGIGYGCGVASQVRNRSARGSQSSLFCLEE